MLVVATLLAAISVTLSGLIRNLMLRRPDGPDGLPTDAGFLPSSNYRGVSVPRVGGLMILCTFLLVEIFIAVIVLAWPVNAADSLASALPELFFSNDHLGLVILVLGFFMLGLLDDAAGTADAKGFRGHFGGLRQGNVSTGVVKAIGGAAVALVAAAVWEGQLVPAVLDAVVVVLAANMINLLDLRPGRAVKAFFLIWLPLTFVTWQMPYLAVSGVIAASAAVWVPVDLRERAMLGDSGANLLGAIAGAGLALSTTVPGKVAVILLLGILTAASEKWSFTKIIEKLGPLKWFDSLGRVREEI